MESAHKDNQEQAPAMGQPPVPQPPAYVAPPSGQLPAYMQNAVASGQMSGYVQTDINGLPPNVVVMTQPAPMVTQPIQKIQDYLTLSLISIFFFWPMAICAIIYSCQSRTSAASGDYSRSLNEGRTARNLSIAAIIVAILIVIATVVPIVVFSQQNHRYVDRRDYGY